MNHNFLIGPTDTDSISFCHPDFKEMSKDEISSLVKEINKISPEFMIWEHDGYFSHVLVVMAKNYYLEYPDGKKVTKGSGLKMSMKSTALKEFGQQFIQTLVHGTVADSVALYNRYVNEIMNLSDISRWCTKKTVTAAVLKPKRTNEQKVFDAIGNEPVQEGDKIFVYFKPDESLSLQQNWNNDHDPYKLLESLWDTTAVFSTVIDIKLFTKYHLKKQRLLLDSFKKVG